ncbi:MAG: AAA family ATPase [Clostridia bacterium]|nr:AAA family ATPase [Clostridia bacterium]
MKLLSLHIENFGTFHDYDLTLDPSMEVLYRENGWGKSTLAVFIKAMLFGLPATTKRSLDENERKKYAPWQGGAYGGSICFSCAKGSFRAERFFGAKESGDTFALYDLSTNRPSAAFSSALGCELFGVDANGFERSTYLSQGLFDLKSGNAEISARLGNLLDDVDDIGSFDAAREYLDKRRRFYVTTGNRGAIAQMEQELLEKQRELEGCMRKDEAHAVQEQELEQLREQFRKAQTSLEQVRAEMQKAALSRERAALVERKNSMLNELNRLSASKKALRDFFQGFPPSTQELDHHLDLYEKIKESQIRIEAMPLGVSDPETFTRLKRTYPAGVPAEENLGRLEQENEELRRVCSRAEALQRIRNEEQPDPRFAAGVPSEARLEAAEAALRQAQRLQEAKDAILQGRKESPRRISPCLVIGILLGVLGMALGALYWLPVAASMGFLSLIAGGGCLAVAVVLLVLALRQSRRRSTAHRAEDAQILTWDEAREKSEASVRGFLKEYGMPGEALSGELTQLTLFAKQQREQRQRQAAMAEELVALERRRGGLVESIRAYLTRFFPQVPVKPDYRAEIDLLCRDRETLVRLDTEARRRQYDRAAAEAMLEDLKRQLHPFLRRYDPKGTLEPAECLALITEKREEYARLCKDMTRRENELKIFIAEKKLEEEMPEEPAGYDRLVAQEAALQKELNELQRKKTLVKANLDRLAADTDRIPDLNAELAQKKEQIRVAKANYATISKTLVLLEESKLALSTRYLGDMQASFDAYLEMLVGEAAPDSMLDDSFEVRLQGGGQTRSMESFSRGWRDAVQFCVRMALTDAMYAEGEPPFLLLDDPFVNLDDERLGAARRMLEELKQKYQIIYMVCQKERA